MIESLRSLGFRILTNWPAAFISVSSGAEEPLIPSRQADLFAGNSGTTMRFLTALVSLGHGRFRLDGVQRMRERPIGDLLDALRQLGADTFSENHNGCPPVIVRADGLRGGRVRVRCDVSSQFLSALLMVAPFARNQVQIEMVGPTVSAPYAQMTVKMVRQFCAGHILEDCPGLGGEPAADFTIFGKGEHISDPEHRITAAAFHNGFDPRKHTLLEAYHIEPDASAASYFWGAAAITSGNITVPDLDKNSIQGDVAFLDVLEEMGCQVLEGPAGLTVKGRRLAGVNVDMNDISDTVMTLAAVACFAEGPTTIRNVAHIRHKETDRLTALANELRRIGTGVEEFPDGLTIIPRPLHGAEIETYDDHRMAMSLALVGLRVPGIVIKNPGCVAKTYPRFFEDLEKLR
jgi:3-phosphoshikimate 1-carboxyvinyltransferase